MFGKPCSRKAVVNGLGNSQLVHQPGMIEHPAWGASPRVCPGTRISTSCPTSRTMRSGNGDGGGGVAIAQALVWRREEELMQTLVRW